MLHYNHTPMQLSQEQQQAIQTLRTNRLVTVIGKAGSGKTTILNWYKHTCRRSHMLLAPSGVAATLIGGTTIHRGLGIPVMDYYPEDYIPDISAHQERILLETDVFIFDEISMIRADLFCLIERIIRATAFPEDQHIPWGNKEVKFLGDPFQLPSIVKDKETEDYLTQHFNGKWFFKTELWRQSLFTTVILEKVYRQGSDKRFLEILNSIRDKSLEGNYHHPYDETPNIPFDAVGALNANVQITPVPQIDSTCLCSTNANANTINVLMDQQLPGPHYRVEGIQIGKFDIKGCPSDRYVEFRLGSRILMLSNEPDYVNGGYLYTNGSAGQIVDYNVNTQTVAIILDSKKYIEVTLKMWLNKEQDIVKDPCTGDERVEMVPVGSFSAMPFRLGYATTIHKSQGMTLDKVFIDLGQQLFAPGQLYTALSRCRSLDSICISRQAIHDDIIVDPEVIEFMGIEAKRISA